MQAGHYPRILVYAGWSTSNVHVYLGICRLVCTISPHVPGYMQTGLYRLCPHIPGYMHLVCIISVHIYGYMQVGLYHHCPHISRYMQAGPYHHCPHISGNTQTGLYRYCIYLGICRTVYTIAGIRIPWFIF